MKLVEHGLLSAVVAVVSMRTRYRRRVLSRIVLKKGTLRAITPLLPFGAFLRPSCRAAAAVWTLAGRFMSTVSVDVYKMPNKTLQPTATVRSVLTGT